MTKMSDHADFSIWSNDEIELLDNINKELKMNKTGSDSDSSKLNKSNQELWKVLKKNEIESNFDEEMIRQSRKLLNPEEIENQQGNGNLDKLKPHYSANDLSNLSLDIVPQNESVPNMGAPFAHSSSHNCLSNNEKPVSKKYDHVESKIKQYFNVSNPVRDITLPRSMNVMTKVNRVREYTDGDHLEQINLRLMRELDEKNALITKLQENYENLLFKYAEAQNKIDHLRFNSACESTKCQVHSSVQQNLAMATHLEAKSGVDRDDQGAWGEGACGGNDIVAPPANYDTQGDQDMKKTDRPSSLLLEGEEGERNVIKISSLTDSEDVSSVITSMSGHSKILNSLNMHGRNARDFNLPKFSDRSFVLDDNPIHDAFSKVKNWQNSLPPLEYIETPETTLYDLPMGPISPPADYNKGSYIGGDKEQEAKIFPPYGNVSSEPLQSKSENYPPEPVMDELLGAACLPPPPPSAAKKKGVTRRVKQKNDYENDQIPRDDPSGAIRRRKKQEFPRCSPVPTYDTPKSSKRNIYIPPLDLENLTLSDVESSKVDYYDSDKRNLGTSSSYLTSQSGSMEFPSQTYRSNYKRRTDEYSDSSFSGRPFNKSTSMTPDRCNDGYPSSLKSNNFCRICGVKLDYRSFPCRSTSYQNFFEVPEEAPIVAEKRGKYPFSRSVSFNSETSSFRRCFHSQDCLLRRAKEDSLEKFDVYTSNLRARSQAVMKALAAHVHNT